MIGKLIKKILEIDSELVKENKNLIIEYNSLIKKNDILAKENTKLSLMLKRITIENNKSSGEIVQMYEILQENGIKTNNVQAMYSEMVKKKYLTL